MSPALFEKTTEQPPNGGKTILIVEDDTLLLEFVFDLLGGQGYSVLSAANSQEAMEHLENDGHTIDLIFSDIRMPGGMDGVRLVRTAREMHPNLKVILTTGFSAEMLEEPVSQEFTIIPKPYRPLELAKIIETLLGTAT